MPPTTGSGAALELVVEEADTARAMGSGDVDVLATPRVLAACEQACCLAVQHELAADETTVGMRVQLDHLAPVRVGTAVRVVANLDKVEGRRLVFVVTVHADDRLVAAGRLTRAIVVRADFLERAR